jgi:Flp pilus assembly secretin CpaC
MNYDLVVSPDVAALRGQLRSIFPEEKVEVFTAGPSIVLKGDVSNEVVYDKLLEVAVTYLPPRQAAEVAPSTNVSVRTTQEARLPSTGTAFAGGGQLAFPEETSPTDVSRWPNKRDIPGIIDLLIIRDTHQIELNVIVAEISMSKLREVGLDFLTTFKIGGSDVVARSNLGSQGGFGSGLLGDVDGDAFTFGDAASAIVGLSSSRFTLLTLFRLFQNRDIAQILAQPRLVIKNGRSGGFLAGGEFPVVRDTEETLDVEFKPFGVRLDFLPTLTWSNTIDLRVFPEVSEIDRTVSVNNVPGLRVRRSVTRLEMREGESLVIAGLLDRRIVKLLTKMPLLGDMPILGALFRSTRFENRETELVFVITPKVVRPLKPGEKPQLPSIEKYDDPDMRQFPLPGPPPKSKPSAQGPTLP